jgi:hypothetical protein
LLTINNPFEGRRYATRLLQAIPARALERYEAQQQRVTADAKAAGDPLQPVVAPFAQAGATDGI